jgi:hypothetical protein
MVEKLLHILVVKELRLSRIPPLEFVKKSERATALLQEIGDVPLRRGREKRNDGGGLDLRRSGHARERNHAG